MADLQLLSASACTELRELLHSQYKQQQETSVTMTPTALKVQCTLSRRQQAEAAVTPKCFARFVDGKLNGGVVVVRNFDERFLKFGIEQDFLIHFTTQDQLSKLLDNKSVFDMNKIVMFRGICGAQSMEWFRVASVRHKGHLHSVVKLQLYKLKDATKLVTTVPEEAELGAITEEADVHRMRVAWLYRELVSGDEFRRIMLSDLATGLFVRMTRPHGAHQYAHDARHLVSWAVTNLEGAISFVTTVAEHQHKGYAKLVVSRLCRLLLDDGRTPTAEVDERNAHSKALFEELGFVRVCDYEWGFHVPDDKLEVDKFFRLYNDLQVIDQRVYSGSTSPAPSPTSTKGGCSDSRVNNPATASKGTLLGSNCGDKTTANNPSKC